MNADVVFLLDVDNTLLDSDSIIADLRQHLHSEFGSTADRFWTHFEALRDELGYADYLGALQRFRAEVEPDGDSAHRLLSMSSFLIDYPFAERLYAHALDVLARLGSLGATVFPRQGHYARDPTQLARYGAADLGVERIGDLLELDIAPWLGAIQEPS